MAKPEDKNTHHFELAQKKVRELGYKHLLDLDKNGTEEHKKVIRKLYEQK